MGTHLKMVNMLKMVKSCDTMSKGKDFKDMARQRDKSIVAILKAIKKSKNKR